MGGWSVSRRSPINDPRSTWLQRGPHLRFRSGPRLHAPPITITLFELPLSIASLLILPSRRAFAVFASTMVVLTHVARAWDSDLFLATSGENVPPRLLQLPILRVLIQGRIESPSSPSSRDMSAPEAHQALASRGTRRPR